MTDLKKLAEEVTKHFEWEVPSHGYQVILEALERVQRETENKHAQLSWQRMQQERPLIEWPSDEEFESLFPPHSQTDYTIGARESYRWLKEKLKIK